MVVETKPLVTNVNAPKPTCCAVAPWAMCCVLDEGHEGKHQDGGMWPVEWSEREFAEVRA